MKYILIIVVAFCIGLVAGYWKADYDHSDLIRFRVDLEEKLFKERLRYHGLDKRFNSVWRDEDGTYRFRDETGREGRFI